MGKAKTQALATRVTVSLAGDRADVPDVPDINCKPLLPAAVHYVNKVHYYLNTHKLLFHPRHTCRFYYRDPSILRRSGPYPLAVPVRDREPFYAFSDRDQDYDVRDPDSNLSIRDQDTDYDVLSGREPVRSRKPELIDRYSN